MLRQYHDSDAGVTRANAVGGVYAFGVVTRRHTNVREYRLRTKAVHGLQQLWSGAHRCSDVDLTGILQQAPDSLTQQVIVFGDDKSNPPSRHRQTRRLESAPESLVPLESDGLNTLNSPPKASTRSANP